MVRQLRKDVPAEVGVRGVVMYIAEKQGAAFMFDGVKIFLD